MADQKGPINRRFQCDTTYVDLAVYRPSRRDRHPDHSGKTISTLAPCSNYKGSIGGKTNMRCFRQGSIIWQPELESHIILD